MPSSQYLGQSIQCILGSIRDEWHTLQVGVEYQVGIFVLRKECYHHGININYPADRAYTDCCAYRPMVSQPHWNPRLQGSSECTSCLTDSGYDAQVSSADCHSRDHSRDAPHNRPVSSLPVCASLGCDVSPCRKNWIVFSVTRCFQQRHLRQGYFFAGEDAAFATMGSGRHLCPFPYLVL